MTAPKIVVPDRGENRCRPSLRLKETIDISLTAEFVTHQEIRPKKRFLYTKQVLRTSGVTVMPRSNLRISIRDLNLVFEPHVQTNKKPSYGRSCIVSDRCIGHISTKKKKEKKRGRLSICWLVHDQHRRV